MWTNPVSELDESGSTVGSPIAACSVKGRCFCKAYALLAFPY